MRLKSFHRTLGPGCDTEKILEIMQCYPIPRQGSSTLQFGYARLDLPELLLMIKSSLLEECKAVLRLLSHGRHQRHIERLLCMAQLTLDCFDLISLDPSVARRR